MASSKPSSSSNKRKSQWPDVEDSFSTNKKQRTNKPATSSSSMHDFNPPVFEPRSSQAKAKEPKPSSSLHASASDLLFKKDTKTPMKSPLPSVRLDTPKPPKLVGAEAKPPPSTKNFMSVLDMPPPRFNQTSGHATTSVKPMKSALRTPLIAGAFASPPKSQSLTVPVADILDDEPSTMHPMQVELERGLAPSPEKGTYASKRQFIRGGLADRAKALMGRSTTDFSLWYEDSASSKKASEAQLMLRVTEIVTFNPPRELPLISNMMPYGTTPRHSVLARCRRLDRNGHPDEEVLVLFSSLHDTPTIAGKQVANPASVRPGLEAHIWKPWTEVSIPLNDDNSDSSLRKVTLCSRFIIK